MNLEEQFKVIFYSFVYGMFFLATIKCLKKIPFKKVAIRFIVSLAFMLSHVSLFYYLLYKINGGMLSFYIILFLSFGAFFCQLLYFGDKKHWNLCNICYIIIL